MDISQKIAELDKLNEVAQGLMLICEFPQVQFATFQFIHSRPDQYASPFVRTTYPEKWVNYDLVARISALLLGCGFPNVLDMVDAV